MNDSEQQWICLLVCSKASKRINNLYAAYVNGGTHRTTEDLEGLTRSLTGRMRPRVLASLLVLDDMRSQGWSLRMRHGEVQAAPPRALTDLLDQKARIRQQELLKRDEQLAQPSVRAFVTSMEAPRLYKGRWVSVFSLMRDGAELAESLAQAVAGPPEMRAARLKETTDPYIEFVTSTNCCRFTGLRLQDVWRYFRHTWTTQYSSTPGRTMMFVVRDRAVSNHPVVGIGALGSPIVQMSGRDAWIGWEPEVFIASIRATPTARYARWLRQIVTDGLAELHTADLLRTLRIRKRALKAADGALIERLQRYAAAERTRHHRFVRAQDYKYGRSIRGDALWLQRSETPLFRSKRASLLAKLLEARGVLDKYLGSKPTARGLARLLADPAGQAAVRTILRKAKADRVGIAMADITVCGAIAPYNPILGGKLVSMLAASPDVVIEYQRRYKSAVSEIASAMAGRRIARPPRLVLLGTTSLYGSGSSQYNRLRMPASVLGGSENDAVEFIELGRSKSYGTSQFRESTVRALVNVIERSKEGQRVNSIFGEGVSPKFRKLRASLDHLGFPSDALLQHGRPRIIYGVPLATNMRGYLLGLEKRPKYIFPRRASSSAIAEWWRSRWLSKRVERPEVLPAVAAHSLQRPTHHGAKVRLLESVASPSPLPSPDLESIAD